jgi:glucose/mannose transport system permease protein
MGTGQMSTGTAAPSTPHLDTLDAVKRKHKLNIKNFDSFLVLLPSLIAIAIFVYGFIGITFYVSLSNWRTVKPDLTLRQPLFQTYADLFALPRFQSDLRNTLVFTVLFIGLSVAVGLGLAILIDRNLKLRFIPLFRNVYLFPYALSFVVTGVVWRWIFNPETGINLFFDILGINNLLSRLGAAPLKPGWITDPTVALQVNSLLSRVLPGVGDLSVKLGIPVALIPVALAATWQLSGFVMATYLGGMSTISDEVREAARVDGATEWQVYRRIVLPMLKPVTLSVIVILLHVSLKIFDLVFTMTGTGPGFATDMPAIFVFETMFRATRYNLAAGAAIVMLVLAALVIVPYLVRSLRSEEQ